MVREILVIEGERSENSSLRGVSEANEAISSKISRLNNKIASAFSKPRNDDFAGILD